MAQAAAHTQAVGAICEVAGIDLCAVEKFGTAESQVLQFALQFSGIEEELERFAGGGNAPGECLERPSLARD